MPNLNEPLPPLSRPPFPSLAPSVVKRLWSLRSHARTNKRHLIVDPAIRPTLMYRPSVTLSHFSLRELGQSNTCVTTPTFYTPLNFGSSLQSLYIFVILYNGNITVQCRYLEYIWRNGCIKRCNSSDNCGKQLWDEVGMVTQDNYTKQKITKVSYQK